jgi:protein prenyltransferase alpha subunit repeat containing protein 1
MSESLKITDEDITSAITDIKNILLSGNDILNLDFIPSFSPPFILYAEKTLGISYALIKPMYKCLYQKVLHYVRYGETDKTEDIDLLTRVVLFLKGDLNVFYNIRKQLILNDLSKLSDEFLFTALVFSKHPKSPSGWEHRRWCYKTRVATRRAPAGTSSLALQLSLPEVITELELCRNMADKYPKNYYAWMHRLWTVQFLSFAQVSIFSL